MATILGRGVRNYLFFSILAAFYVNQFAPTTALLGEFPLMADGKIPPGFSIPNHHQPYSATHPVLMTLF